MRMPAAPRWMRKRSKVRKPISIAKHTSKTANIVVARPDGLPSSNIIQILKRICLSSSNCSLEVAPPVKKRKVGTAALTEENGDEDEDEEDAAAEDEDANGEEEAPAADADAETEEPADVAVKKTNGAAAPKKAEVETVDLDEEDE